MTQVNEGTHAPGCMHGHMKDILVGSDAKEAKGAEHPAINNGIVDGDVLISVQGQSCCWSGRNLRDIRIDRDVAGLGAGVASADVDHYVFCFFNKSSLNGVRACANFVGAGGIKNMCCFSVLRFYCYGVVVVKKGNSVEINAVCRG